MRRCLSWYARLSGSVRGLCCALLIAPAVCFTLVEIGPPSAVAAEWIWSPEQTAGAVPAGACYFRKDFAGGDFRSAKLKIAGDDEFDVYLNGRRIVQGKGWQDPKTYNIRPLVHAGNNVLAIKVTNTEGSAAGLAATIEITQKDGHKLTYATDETWKTSLRPLAFWHLPRYSDNRWDSAQSLGEEGKTAPWTVAADEPPAENPHETAAVPSASAPSESAPSATAAADDDYPPAPVAATDDNEAGSQPPARRAPAENQPTFRTQKNFEVQVLATHEQVGSLIAAEFNEFHELVLSKENGPLIIMVDSNKDGLPDSPRLYCDEVKNVQGILPINGEVFVTGEGPQGAGLFRLADVDKDGQMEIADTLIKFRHANDDKEMVGEHGPHGLALGPDGNIYVVVGNHAVVDGELDDDSPYDIAYEGDIIPRFEDPTGHAHSIKAPGGAVLRIPLRGGKPQRVAGGLRNAYDLAFDQWGNLFTYDSDMEADEGALWYQPTRVNQIIPGGEYGWRSGWAKWPTYWHDRLPPIAETGRGSPTGLVVYDHFMFPEKFHHDLLMADWTGGRILHLDVEPDGASFKTKTDVLLQGEPLTITDLTVGPDGWLYFVTGGRETAGAVYRLVYKGETPEVANRIGTGVAAAIRYPQFQSAWSRQAIAKIKHQEADRWDAILPAIARTEKNTPRFRTRALDLMHLYGPPVSEELLTRLSSDQSPQVRAKAVELMGWRPKDAYHQALVARLSDKDAAVRRTACEALVRAAAQPPVDKLWPVLKSKDRAEAFAARRLLETIPTEQWRDAVLASEDSRLFIQGGTALLIVEANKQNAQAVLGRFGDLLAGYISDDDFTDMLRLAQIAIERGQIKAADIPELTTALADEFPSTNKRMNRELLRLLVALEVNTIADRYIAYLESDLQPAEHLQVAVHLALIHGGWTSQQRLTLLKHLEEVRGQGGGASRGAYVQNVTRSFAEQLNEQEKRQVLGQAAEMPTAAVATLFQLPEQLEPATLDALRQAYAQVDSNSDEASQQLQIGIIAVLGESADETSMDFLRRQYPNHPNKQAFLAMSLAQSPDGDNWDFLLDALRVVEGESAKMVLDALASVDRAPSTPEPYRQTIIRGLEMGADAQAAIKLLEHWTGKSQAGQSAPEQLAGWQKWFRLRWPQEPAADLPKTSNESKWIFNELAAHVSDETKLAAGSADRGAAVFKRAQCAKCHRYGDEGESVGPDLTNITRRFRRKDILESIVYPSHYISDQYRSKTVLTDRGRQYTGIVAAGAPGEVVVLQQDGKKVVLKQDEIDDTAPSKLSAMPEGLLNDLSLQEVTDLFTFLSKPPSASTAQRPKQD